VTERAPEWGEEQDKVAVEVVALPKGQAEIASAQSVAKKYLINRE